MRVDRIEVPHCGAVANLCVCGEPVDHEPPHVCVMKDDEGCGGQWTGDIDGPDFAVVVYPLPARILMGLIEPS